MPLPTNVMDSRLGLGRWLLRLLTKYTISQLFLNVYLSNKKESGQKGFFFVEN